MFSLLKQNNKQMPMLFWDLILEKVDSVSKLKEQSALQHSTARCNHFLCYSKNVFSWYSPKNIFSLTWPIRAMTVKLVPFLKAFLKAISNIYSWIVELSLAVLNICLSLHIKCRQGFSKPHLKRNRWARKWDLETGRNCIALIPCLISLFGLKVEITGMTHW